MCNVGRGLQLARMHVVKGRAGPTIKPIKSWLETPNKKGSQNFDDSCVDITFRKRMIRFRIKKMTFFFFPY